MAEKESSEKSDKDKAFEKSLIDKFDIKKFVHPLFRSLAESEKLVYNKTLLQKGEPRTNEEASMPSSQSRYSWESIS